MTTKIRRYFDEEFKKEAASLVIDQGYTTREAAEVVGTSVGNIRRWVRLQKAESTGERLPSDERAELQRLRRENRQLKMEKEILKKASLGSMDQRNTLIEGLGRR